MRSATITELIAGYDTYASADEVNVPAAARAPATTPWCASAGISWMSGQLVSKLTVGWSC